MDSQNRMESAFVQNVPHPECRGSDTCAPELSHCDDNNQCNQSGARQNRNLSAGQCTKSSSQKTCNQLTDAPAMAEPVCQKCHTSPGSCKAGCPSRIDDGVHQESCNLKFNQAQQNTAQCTQSCNQQQQQQQSFQPFAQGTLPLTTAPAMTEPTCQKCHQCPGTCNPGCGPRIDEGLNRNDIPIAMNIDGSLERVIPAEQPQPTIASHRPPDRITRTSAAPANTTNRAAATVGQTKLYGLSLEQQYKRALFYVRHAPQQVEAEYREHNGRIQREALYHQIEEGDNSQAQPWAIQVEEREKWDAWNKLRGLSKEQAMLQYLQKVSEVDPYWMDSPEVQNFTPIDENPRDMMVL